MILIDRWFEIGHNSHRYHSYLNKCERTRITSIQSWIQSTDRCLKLNVCHLNHFEYVHSYLIEYSMAKCKDERIQLNNRHESNVFKYLFTTEDFIRYQSIFEYNRWTKNDVILKNWNRSNTSLKNQRNLIDEFNRNERTQWRPKAIDNQNVKHKLIATMNIKTIKRQYKHRFLHP